ncbi:unnamed protein product, partial [Amoebophrya sp. A25]
ARATGNVQNLVLKRSERTGIDFATDSEPLSGVARPTLSGYYEDEGALGEGGFGAVFLAKHRLTGELRAVKQIDIGNSNPKLLSTELSLLLNLDHPSIVKIYDWFEESGYLYMVMEYCGGGELEDVLRDARRHEDPGYEEGEHASNFFAADGDAVGKKDLQQTQPQRLPDGRLSSVMMQKKQVAGAGAPVDKSKPMSRFSNAVVDSTVAAAPISGFQGSRYLTPSAFRRT